MQALVVPKALAFTVDDILWSEASDDFRFWSARHLDKQPDRATQGEKKAKREDIEMEEKEKEKKEARAHLAKRPAARSGGLLARKRPAARSGGLLARVQEIRRAKEARQDPSTTTPQSPKKRQKKKKKSKISKRRSLIPMWLAQHHKAFRNAGLAWPPTIHPDPCNEFTERLCPRSAQALMYDEARNPRKSFGRRFIQLGQSIARLNGKNEQLQTIIPKGFLWGRGRQNPVWGMELLQMQGLCTCMAPAVRSFADSLLVDLAGAATNKQNYINTDNTMYISCV